MVTRAVYRSNGNPDLRRRRPPRAHLDRRGDGQRRTASPTQLTSGEFDERGAAVVARRQRHLLHVGPRAESYYEPSDADLYRVPAAGGEITKIASIDGPIGIDLGRRPTASASRSSARCNGTAGALVQPARPLGRRRRAGQHAAAT